MPTRFNSTNSMHYWPIDATRAGYVRIVSKDPDCCTVEEQRSSTLCHRTRSAGK